MKGVSNEQMTIFQFI
ncbi:Protein of unknown function [Bacillus mycoides]|nr:Protein of unknown function [Bacillus mycoides]